MKKYTFISDPGHGWLKVPVVEILALGIAGKISSCSYIDYAMRNAYLEEDCDFEVFAKAKGWTPGSISEHITEEHQENCKIRRLQPFPGKHLAQHVEMVTA